MHGSLFLTSNKLTFKVYLVDQLIDESFSINKEVKSQPPPQKKKDYVSISRLES